MHFSISTSSDLSSIWYLLFVCIVFYFKSTPLVTVTQTTASNFDNFMLDIYHFFLLSDFATKRWHTQVQQSLLINQYHLQFICMPMFMYVNECFKVNMKFSVPTHDNQLFYIVYWDRSTLLSALIDIFTVIKI